MIRRVNGVAITFVGRTPTEEGLVCHFSRNPPLPTRWNAAEVLPAFGIETPNGYRISEYSDGMMVVTVWG